MCLYFTYINFGTKVHTVLVYWLVNTHGFQRVERLKTNRLRAIITATVVRKWQKITNDLFKYWF